MAVKTIEAKARISAEDRTGDTFSAVARKVKGLEHTAASASKRMDSLARGMSAVGEKTALHASIAARMAAPTLAATAGSAAFVSRAAAVSSRAAAIRGGVADFAAGALPGAVFMGGGAPAVGGLVVGGATAYGLHEAISFDKAMSEIKKKVNLDEGATWDDVEGMINKTSRDLGVSRENVAALTAQAGQAGIAYKDLAEFITLAAKASSAWDIGAKESAQMLSEIKAQTSWTNKELTTYADKVNYLGDISAAAEKNISEMWSRASAGAKAAGVSYDDSMVALTAMKSVGMEPEVASRAFGQFSSRLRTATTQNGDFKTAAKALGYTPKQLEGAMKRDGMGTMLDVLDKMGKSPDAVKIATGLGGKEWWDEFSRMKDARPEMIRLREGLASGKWNGSLGTALATDLATTSKHLERFGALASEVGDKLTRWALPSINERLDQTIKLFDKMQKDGAGAVARDMAPGVASVVDGVSQKGVLGWANGLVVDAGKAAPSTSSSWLPSWASSGYAAVGDAIANNPWARLSAMGNAIDAEKAPGLVKAVRAFGAGPARSGALNFGVGGPVGPAIQGGTPIAKLEGAANIVLEIKVSTDKDSVVNDVIQRLSASGALKTEGDVGTTMAPGWR